MSWFKPRWLRSYIQGQGQSAHITKISVRVTTANCHVGSGYYFTQLLSMSQRCVKTLTQDHAYLQGQGHSAHISKNYVRAITPVMSDLDSVVYNPTVCHDLDPRSYLQGQGHSAHWTKILNCQTHKSLLSCWIWVLLYTIYSWLWLESFTSSRSVSQFTRCKDLFPPGHNLSWVTWIGMMLHEIVVHVTGVVVHCGGYLSR